MEMVAGDESPAIRQTVLTQLAAEASAVRAVTQAPRPLMSSGWPSRSLASLALSVVLGSIIILPTSAAAADEIPKPETAYCIGDKAHPGKFGCAEAGWSAGAVHRNLGVRQRVEGSESEQRLVITTMVKTERYYDEEVPLMPKDVQDNW